MPPELERQSVGVDGDPAWWIDRHNHDEEKPWHSYIGRRRPQVVGVLDREGEAEIPGQAVVR